MTLNCYWHVDYPNITHIRVEKITNMDSIVSNLSYYPETFCCSRLCRTNLWASRFLWSFVSHYEQSIKWCFHAGFPSGGFGGGWYSICDIFGLGLLQPTHLSLPLPYGTKSRQREEQEALVQIVFMRTTFIWSLTNWTMTAIKLTFGSMHNAETHLFFQFNKECSVRRAKTNTKSQSLK